MDAQLPHYAEVWTTDGPRCFRYIHEPTTTRPTRCPHPATWTGIHIDGVGQRRKVRACNGHRGGLEQAHRLHTG